MAMESVTTSVAKKSILFENVSLDKALDLTGYGWFHYAVVAASSLSLLSVGLQYALSAYILPAANCELQLESSQIGFVNAAFLIGGTSGSLLWGVLADLTGRRRALISTLLSDVIVTICCSMMQEFFGLVVCRFFNGFLIGAPGSITYTYLAEFHAPHQRAKSIFFAGIFNTLAWLLLPVVARLILPYDIHFKIGSFVLISSWRMFLILLMVPELIAGLWILYLPESPKYLATNNLKSSLSVLRQMFATNTGKEASDYSVKSLKPEFKKPCCSTVQCSGKIARLTQEISSQLKKLFKEPFWRLTLLLGVITFTNMFGYFGLGLWLPQLLTRYQSVSDNSTTFDNTSDNSTCKFHFNSNLFGSTFAMGITSLVTNIISGLVSGNLKPKVIPLILMLTGGISAASFYWTHSSLQALIAASVFQSSMSTTNVALSSIVVDLFPTSVNAMAVCSAMFSGRVGAILSNIIFGFLMDHYEKVAIALVALILLIGAFLCFLIPGEQKPEVDNSKSTVELSTISSPSL